MDVKWKLSILTDAFHKFYGVLCSMTKHVFIIAFYKPTCPVGFPLAEILFRRVSLVGALLISGTNLNGLLVVSFGIVKST